MFRLITRRRRAEDARVARFLLAIELSGRYAINPEWELQTVPDEAPQPATMPTQWGTDTAWLPRIVLAGTPL